MILFARTGAADAGARGISAFLVPMDLPHQQRLRDVMGLEIGDGTAQVMKLIVARERAGRMAVQYAAENRK